MASFMREAAVQGGETSTGKARKNRLACGPRCWNAKRELCGCPCGGLNHGVGHDAALKNAIEMAKAGKEGVEFNVKFILSEAAKLNLDTTGIATPEKKGKGKKVTTPATEEKTDKVEDVATGENVTVVEPASAVAVETVTPEGVPAKMNGKKRDAKGHFIKG